MADDDFPLYGIGALLSHQRCLTGAQQDIFSLMGEIQALEKIAREWGEVGEMIFENCDRGILPPEILEAPLTMGRVIRLAEFAAEHWAKEKDEDHA